MIFNTAVITAMNKPRITPAVCKSSVVLIDIDNTDDTIPYSGFLVSVSVIDANNKDAISSLFTYKYTGLNIKYR